MTKELTEMPEATGGDLTTLLPGTVIVTGTPAGAGVSRTPPVFLQPGDTIEVEIEPIGRLTNPVVASETVAAAA